MTAELPDFHIPHAEKIEWMIETDGFAVEPVPPALDSEPPQAGLHVHDRLSRRTPASPTWSCSG